MIRKLALLICLIAAVAINPAPFFTTAAEAAAETIVGTIVNIDESAGKITLKHGPIKSLGMNEGMTMVFAVQDVSMLKGLKVGDKVRFQPDQINGQFTVTKIEKAN